MSQSRNVSERLGYVTITRAASISGWSEGKQKQSLSYSAIARLELRRRLIFFGRVDISGRCVLLEYITCPG